MGAGRAGMLCCSPRPQIDCTSARLGDNLSSVAKVGRCREPSGTWASPARLAGPTQVPRAERHASPARLAGPTIFCSYLVFGLPFFIVTAHHVERSPSLDFYRYATAFQI